ncbi:hypothetical protein KAW65_07665 [candidate division WOR-3 bacterium]|nr:hypothetical protein [candidate division WOR-3 bacterium]
MASRSQQKIISLPSSLIGEHADRFFDEFNEALQSRCQNVLFDFSSVQLPAPFGVVVSAIEIIQLIGKGKKVLYRAPHDKKAKNELKKMGFEKFFALRDTTKSVKGETVELRRFTTKDLTHSREIVEVLKYQMNLSEGVESFVYMSINEIIINSFDHAGSNPTCPGCFLCAQWYPNTQYIRVCIADAGMGIKSRLATKYDKVKRHRDCYAIREAVKPEVTTREHIGGTGLDHINRFIRANNGIMTIISGNGKVRFRAKTIWRYKMSSRFNGTLIDLKINADKKSWYSLKSEIF